MSTGGWDPQTNGRADCASHVKVYYLVPYDFSRFVIHKLEVRARRSVCDSTRANPPMLANQRGVRHLSQRRLHHRHTGPAMSATSASMSCSVTPRQRGSGDDAERANQPAGWAGWHGGACALIALVPTDPTPGGARQLFHAGLDNQTERHCGAMSVWRLRSWLIHPQEPGLKAVTPA